MDTDRGDRVQADTARFRIGEVARRAGVSVSTLRAWERRYELLEPTRTEGGHRLYNSLDLARVQRTKTLIDEGWSASAAAAEAREQQLEPSGATPLVAAATPAEDLQQRLREGLDQLDAAAVDRALDDLLALLDLGTAFDEVLTPVLRWSGEGWQDDPRVVAREHFATNALRPRLLRLLRTSIDVAGRDLVAAAPDGENHDLGLLTAAAVAAAAGWRVRFLGASTPTVALEETVRRVGAPLVLVAAMTRERAQGFLDSRPDLAGATVVAGGPGFAGLDLSPLDHAVYHDGPLAELPRTLEYVAR